MTQRAISLPFSFDGSGAVSYTTDDKKIWQDRVVLVIMTRLNERLMRPSFGTATQEFTFENYEDALGQIRQVISVGFKRWLPDLTLNNVNGTIDTVDGNLNLEVNYSYGTHLNDIVTIKSAIISRSGDIIQEIPHV